MNQCPVCLVALEDETDFCACGYSYSAEQIIPDGRIRSYVAQVAKRSWQELVRLKKRINDIQLKKHGTHSTHPSPSGSKIGWSERRTAEMLGEAQASTSQDIRLAEAIEKYPHLAECKKKTEAKKTLKLLQKSTPPWSTAVAFERESELQSYLEQHWSETSLSADWALYHKSNFNTAIVGEMDLLAKHRREPKWLVIELKKWQSSDETVGQVLRYMGWVKDQLAEEGDEVRGLIITHTAEERIHHALSMVPTVDLMLYQVCDGNIVLDLANTVQERMIIQLMRLPLAEKQRFLQLLMQDTRGRGST